MNFIKPLWPHQEKAFHEAVRIYEEVQTLPDPESRQAGYALFFEPRCGKTAVAINVLRYLCTTRRRKLRTLVFCPPRVVPNWRNEFFIHSKFTANDIALLQGAGSKRCDAFMALSSGGASVFVTNYESLLMGELFELFTAWRPEFIVFDESHRLKDIKAKRSKLAEQLSNPRVAVGKEKLIRGAPYKMILTGSPVLNSPMDLYQQFKIMDGGETFGYWDYRTNRQEPLSFRGFQLTYFVDRNAGMPKNKYFPKWELKTKERDGVDAMAQISAKIAEKGMRITRKECLTLPPTSQVTIETDLSAEQKKLYSEMKAEFITWYKSQAVVARLALTKTLRLLQITSGFVKTEEGQELYLESIPKQDALRELLEDLLPSGKALVWSVFKENYRQIREVCEGLGVDFVEVHGDISPAQQDRNVLRFQTDPTCRVFIGHPESGGEGINLVQAPYNIFYSRTHSLKHSIQASARNQSQDSKHEKTVRYDIVAKGTIDQLVADLVQEKEDMTEAVYSALVLKNLLAT